MGSESSHESSPETHKSRKVEAHDLPSKKLTSATESDHLASDSSDNESEVGDDMAVFLDESNTNGLYGKHVSKFLISSSSGLRNMSVPGSWEEVKEHHVFDRFKAHLDDWKQSSPILGDAEYDDYLEVINTDIDYLASIKKENCKLFEYKYNGKLQVAIFYEPTKDKGVDTAEIHSLQYDFSTQKEDLVNILSLLFARFYNDSIYRVTADANSDFLADIYKKLDFVPANS